MKKNNIELKIYKAIFYMLLIAGIVVICMIVYKYGSNQKNEKEMTQKEVADLLGISQSYISRLEKRIMQKLKKEDT